MGLLDDAIREHLELKRQRGASDEELQRAEQEALGPARREAGADPAGLGLPALEEVPGEPIAPPPDAGEPLAEVTELHPEPPADQPTAIRSTLSGAGEMPDPAAGAEPPPPPPPVDEPVFADEYATEPAPADEDDEDYLELDPAIEAEPPGTAKPHGDPMIGRHDDYVVTPGEPTADPEPEPHGDPLSDSEADYDPDEVPAEERLSGDGPDPDRIRTTILDDPLEQMGPPPEEEPPPHGEQDVLEETPDFLQETPEHDKLWFEQKPPRDFDFD